MRLVPSPIAVGISTGCDASVRRFEANLAQLKTTLPQVAASLTASLTACHSRSEWEQTDARHADQGDTTESVSDRARLPNGERADADVLERVRALRKDNLPHHAFGNPAAGLRRGEPVPATPNSATESIYPGAVRDKPTMALVTRAFPQLRCGRLPEMQILKVAARSIATVVAMLIWPVGTNRPL
jgi:hypothetical protein